MTYYSDDLLETRLDLDSLVDSLESEAGYCFSRAQQEVGCSWNGLDTKRKAAF